MQLSALHCLPYVAVRPALFAVCCCPTRTLCCIQLSAPHSLLYTAVLPALFAVCKLSALHWLLYTAVLHASTDVQLLTLAKLYHTQFSDQCGTVGFQNCWN